MQLQNLINQFEFKNKKEKQLYELKNLNLLINQYKNSNVAIYGTGGHTKMLFDLVDFSLVNIIGLVDQDKDKIGNEIFGYQVYELKALEDKIDIIIISSDVFQEIIFERNQYLEQKGIKVIKIYSERMINGYYEKSHERLYFHNDEELATQKFEYFDIGVATHFNRYIWSTFAAYKKEVLDVACGCGYGTSLLAEYAKSVVGVDLDAVTIKYAQKYFSASNIKYIVSNIMNINEDKQFDVITSFETIEHVAEEKLYINKIKKLLKDDGIFIVSTPVAPLNGQSKTNPWHVNEFTEERFTEFLKEHFGNVRMFSQDIYNYGAIGFREAIPGELEPYKYCLIACCYK